MCAASRRLLMGTNCARRRDLSLSVAETSLNWRLKTDFLKVALMVWGRRPIFTPPTPQRPPSLPISQTATTAIANVLIKCEREMGASPSRRNHLPLVLLCCDSSSHQGPFAVPPRREERGRWLASSLFLAFNRVTTNAASERRVAPL